MHKNSNYSFFSCEKSPEMVGYGRKHIPKMFNSERLEIRNDSTLIFSERFINSSKRRFTKDRNFQCYFRFALYYWWTIYKI